mgnify:FL=1
MLILYMFERITGYVEQAMSGSESFQNLGDGSILLTVLIISLIILIIFLFIGKFLWNRTLVPAISGIKPVDSILQFIGIYILIQLLISQ